MSSGLELGEIGLAAGAWLTNLILLGFIGAILAGGLVFLHFTGYFIKRPYKCEVYVERANGSAKLYGTIPGRVITTKDKPNTFGLKYGLFDEAITSEVAGKYIESDNTIVFYRTGENAHYPAMRTVKGDTISIEPSMAPEARLAHSTMIRENHRRWEKPNFLLQYGLHIILVLGFVVMIFTWLYGVQQILGHIDAAGAPWKDALKDAEVVRIEKPAPQNKTTIGAPINPQIPIPPG